MKLIVAHLFKQFMPGEIILRSHRHENLKPKESAVFHTNVQGSHFKAPPLDPVLRQLNPADIPHPISVTPILILSSHLI